jgi:hypothetical protein
MSLYAVSSNQPLALSQACVSSDMMTVSLNVAVLAVAATATATATAGSSS